jgi:hypothetical protein
MNVAQLAEAAPQLLRPTVVERALEQDDDVVVLPEAGEVLEREVDRPCHRTATAERVELVELPLAAMIRRRHDSRNGGYWSVTSVQA